MVDIVIHQEPPPLRETILITAFAGWNDASEVATWSARYLVEQWAATRFAEIESEDFYVFTEARPQARIDDAGQRQIDWPVNEFFFHRSTVAGPDFLVLIGVEPHLKWKTFAGMVLDVVQRYDVKVLFTLGGLLAAIPHSAPARLSASSTDPDLMQRLGGVRPRRRGYQGPTGILGVLNALCAKEGIATASIWGNVPHYLQATPNFKVTAALLRRLDSAFELNLDLSSADALAAQFEGEVDEAISRTPDVALYVQQLEEQSRDEDDQREASAPPSELPSSDVLVQELEEFLRRRRESGPG